MLRSEMRSCKKIRTLERNVGSAENVAAYFRPVLGSLHVAFAIRLPLYCLESLIHEVVIHRLLVPNLTTNYNPFCHPDL